MQKNGLPGEGGHEGLAQRTIGFNYLLAEVSHDEAKMRGRRETLSLIPLILPRRERPLLAGKGFINIRVNYCALRWIARN